MKIALKYPEVDYGPLTLLIGKWTGDKGMDVAPHPDEEKEENPYTETITFEESGALKNAKKQTVSMVRYLQVVSRKSNGETFHEQVGFFMWDADTQTVMHSLTIPRGLALRRASPLPGPRGRRADRRDRPRPRSRLHRDQAQPVDDDHRARNDEHRVIPLAVLRIRGLTGSGRYSRNAGSSFGTPRSASARSSFVRSTR